MKRFVFALLLVLTLGTAFANPIELKSIGRLWFTEAGTAQMEVNYDLQGFGNMNLIVDDGTETYNLSIDANAPMPIVVDLPSANISREAGYLYISSPGMLHDLATWGSSIDKKFSPLIGTQCVTQLLRAGWDNSYHMFAKDYSPTSGTWDDTLARCTINVHCRQPNGSPLVNYPLSMQGNYPPQAYTDENGDASFSYYCCRANISVRNPETCFPIAENVFFTEPDQSYEVNFVINPSAIDDPQSPQAPASLSLYPSVMRLGQSDRVSVSYSAKLSSSALLQLFDLKGRLLTSREYSGKQEMWQLPQLSSGVYFVRLSDGARVLGNSKLIVLK